MHKVAFITGFTGQDGTFLTDLLLTKGYKVIGLVRRISTEPPQRVRGRFDFSPAIEAGDLILEEGDLLSPSSLNRIIATHQPDEVYNLAAQSHVGQSFLQPEYTIHTILDGTINLITALETAHRGSWRMYQASTSEMFGHRNSPVTFHERSHFKPSSPYAIAKFAAHQYCVMKRNQGRFISCGILFNHESEIRGGNFVTQKIARGAVQFAIDYQELDPEINPLRLGFLDSKRDWGYAGDYVKGMWLMLQADNPDDFVLATGEAHSIREFALAAYAHLGYKLVSNQMEGLAEQLQLESWEGHEVKGEPIAAVVVDRKFYRPNDVGYLIGNASKAKEILGWEPEHKFDLIVKVMVDNAKQEREEYER